MNNFAKRLLAKDVTAALRVEVPSGSEFDDEEQMSDNLVAITQLLNMQALVNCSTSLDKEHHTKMKMYLREAREAWDLFIEEFNKTQE